MFNISIITINGFGLLSFGFMQNDEHVLSEKRNVKTKLKGTSAIGSVCSCESGAKE